MFESVIWSCSSKNISERVWIILEGKSKRWINEDHLIAYNMNEYVFTSYLGLLLTEGGTDVNDFGSPGAKLITGMKIVLDDDMNFV